MTAEMSNDNMQPGPLGRVLIFLSDLLATGGGLVLLSIALMTVASIIGRSLFSAPVPGDFELVEIGCAISVFAFLPYCQMNYGNVVVDFFTHNVSARIRNRMDAVGSLVYGVIAALLTWRLTLGGYDMYRYGEETMILGLSRWWGFIPMVVSLGLLTLVCLYTSHSQWRSTSDNLH